MVHGREFRLAGARIYDFADAAADYLLGLELTSLSFRLESLLPFRTVRQSPHHVEADAAVGLVGRWPSAVDTAVCVVTELGRERCEPHSPLYVWRIDVGDDRVSQIRVPALVHAEV